MASIRRPYGSMEFHTKTIWFHGIPYEDHIVPCNSMHATIWFHVWNSMEVIDCMVPCMESYGIAHIICTR